MNNGGRGKYYFEVVFERIGIHLFGILIILFHVLGLRLYSFICFGLMLYCISSYRFYRILDEISKIKENECLEENTCENEEQE